MFEIYRSRVNDWALSPRRYQRRDPVWCDSRARGEAGARAQIASEVSHLWESRITRSIDWSQIIVWPWWPGQYTSDFRGRPGIIAMVRRVTMREHGTEYWVRPATAAATMVLVRYNLSSQGWRGEDIGILVRSHCHLHYRSRPGPQPHYDTGCSLQHEFYAFWGNLTEGKSWLRKGFARAVRRRYLSYQFSCSKSNQI